MGEVFYDVYRVNAASKNPHVGGVKLNATPMTKAGAAIFISKCTRYPGRVLVTRPVTRAEAMADYRALIRKKNQTQADAVHIRWYAEILGIQDTASWVLVSLADGKAFAETFQRHVAMAVNKKKYRAVPIHEYLAGLNAAIKAGKV